MRFLPREKWDSVVLKENDNLEVLRFVGGGIKMDDKLIIGAGKLSAGFSSVPVNFPQTG